MNKTFFILVAAQIVVLFDIAVTQTVKADEQPVTGELSPSADSVFFQHSTLSAVRDQVPDNESAPVSSPEEMTIKRNDATGYMARILADSSVRTAKGSSVSANGPDESVVIARNGGTVVMQECNIAKEGFSSDISDSRFNGRNATVLGNNSTIQLTDSSISSTGEGATAVFSTANATITVEHVLISTFEDSSGGLYANHGGTINAQDVSISTQGQHSAALRCSYGEGFIFINGAQLNTTGNASPCIYSSGVIKASNVVGMAVGSEIAVVEGKNAVILERAELTGRVNNGIMLYQNADDETANGVASFTAKDSILTNLSEGPMFFVTNTRADIYLENTKLNSNSEILLRSAAGKWGAEGRNGGNTTLNCVNQELRGQITADNLSTVTLNLKGNSRFQGTFNGNFSAREANISLEKNAVWSLTGNARVDSLLDEDPSLSNISSYGFNIYYNENRCPQFEGKIIPLPGGGKLEPQVFY